MEILVVAMVVPVILDMNAAEMVIAKSKEEYAVLMALIAVPAIIALWQDAIRTKVAENLTNLTVEDQRALVGVARQFH